jgi:hypothetical protein
MALPSYTEDTLKTYLHTIAPTLSAVLSWTVEDGSYDELVLDVLVLLGVSELTNQSSVTQTGRVRAAAKIAYWRAAINELVTRYDYSSGSGSSSRGQMIANAKDALGLAEAEGARLGLSIAVPDAEVGTVTYADDPYRSDASSWFLFRRPGRANES